MTPRSGCRSARPAIAAPRSARRSTKTTSWPPPRPSASTGPARASTARCTWAPTRTRCPSRPPPARWRCWRPTTCTCWSTPGAGTRPTPAVSRAILAHNAVRPRGPGRRDRGHAVAQPAPGRRLQVQPARRRPGRHRHHRAGSRTGPTSCWPPGSSGVRRVPLARALAADTTGKFDFLDRYVAALPRVIDLDAIRAAGVRIGADPLGGASVAYWGEIGQRYGLDLTVVNPAVDATFRFMTLDWDGKIRMDCSSPYAMASLISRAARVHDRDRERHRLRPARHRHARTRACSTPTTTSRWPSSTCTGTGTAGPPAPRWARPWSAPR